MKLSIENMMSMDGAILAFVVSYARMFTKAESGLPQLNAKTVYRDKELLRVHERIMSLRHQRYAHAGGDDSIEYELEIAISAARIKLNPRVAIGIPGNEFAQYRRLIDALQAFMYDRVHQLAEKASLALGVPVEFPAGERPTYAPAT